ncbi:MAG: IS5 family transposase [Deltaproteobacteria bacterium]|nr:IS5 family transposase [Deltaproteobacteria bacterium]
MRGDDRQQGSMFSYRSLEDRIPADHPLRLMRERVDTALESMGPAFETLYAAMGRPSIPPERLLRALLLQILHSIRSERQLMEQLEYNLLFRWFVGLGMDDPVWVATTFTKNRDRLLEGEIAQAFFDAVLAQAAGEKLLSSEHFSVDGTLIEAWASHKSFGPKKRGRPNSRKKRRDRHRRGGGPKNPTVNFRGERRLNDTHASTTDPEARLMRRKGQESKLSYQGHVLMENRHGLVVGARLTQADGYAERRAALAMLGNLPSGPRVTLGADRGYDTEDFVEGCRELAVTPHVAQNTTNRSSRIDGRTTRHAGYVESQKRRKRVEEVFGWMKTVGLMRKTRHRGRRKVGWVFPFTAAAYNLVRIRNLALAG